MQKGWFYAISLKAKLLLLSVVFCAVPFIGWQLIKGQEQSINHATKQQLVDYAKPLQYLLEQQLAQNPNFLQHILGKQQENAFPVASAESSILIDGFDDEWFTYESHQRVIENFGQTASAIVAKGKHYYFLVISAEDNSLIYPKLSQLSGLSDKVIINFGNIALQFIPEAPGKVSAYRQTEHGLEKIPSIYAVWQETTQGFTIEARIPVALTGNSFSAEWYDVDKDQQGQLLQGIYSFTQFEQRPIVFSRQEDVLSQFEAGTMQLRLLNKHGEVLGISGQLQSAESLGWFEQFWIKMLGYRISSDKHIDVIDPNSGKTRLSNQWLDQALSGSFAIVNTETPYLGEQSKTPLNETFSIYAPLEHNGSVIGAFNLTTSATHHKIMARSFWIKLTLMVVVLMFWVVWMMVRHIRLYEQRVLKLRNAAESISSQHGVVTQPIELDDIYGDEIADLTNSFSILTHRLKDHHEYQQQLSARLNHELRTPIAIVRSSLDNLALSTLSEDDMSLLHTAQQGTQRLSQTLSKLAEASRLEQMLKDTPKESLDLCELIQELIQSYRLNWAEKTFLFECPEQAIVIQGSKPLFAQMMDKIISNAVDFDDGKEPIKLTLNQEKTQTRLTVSNSGPSIDKSERKKMFLLMHSSRKGPNNLGLGLAIAKLIAHFHGAKISATNFYNKKGVNINVLWKN